MDMKRINAGKLRAMDIHSKKSRGFTLVELTVVTILIGIVMTMGMKMLNTTLNNAAFSETRLKQQQLKTVLIGFLRTNGRLPCPDNTVGVATGQESSPCAGNQSDSFGVIPWKTLGIPRDTALDGWGNFFSYKVLNGTGATKNWTSKTAVNAFSITELKNPSPGLSIQELNAAGDELANVTTSGVLAIVSHGKNGFGAKTLKSATRIPSDEAGDGEKANSNDEGATFIMRSVNEDTDAFNGAYDDMVTFMSPQELFQPLLNEGSLKACPAYCDSAVNSSCSVLDQTCSCPSGVGVDGTAVTCTGTCTKCAVSTPPCTTVIQIPIGLSPVSCPL